MIEFTQPASKMPGNCSFEFLMASPLVDGVILSAAVVQAERRISRSDAVCNERSLDPLVKTRALRDDALQDLEFKLSNCQFPRKFDNLPSCHVLSNFRLACSSNTY